MVGNGPTFERIENNPIIRLLSFSVLNEHPAVFFKDSITIRFTQIKILFGNFNYFGVNVHNINVQTRELFA